MQSTTTLFSSKLHGILDEIGCHPLPGQEYLLRQNYADFRFRVRKGKYDKGLMKLIIIEGFAQQGCMRVTFAQSQEDQTDTRNSTTHDYFTAKVSYI